MPVRTSEATWEGNLSRGKGEMEMKSGAYRGPYTFASRFEDGAGTNPEELIAAAHAGCFSMKLSGVLEAAGFEAKRIRTRANVHLDKGDAGFGISRIVLETEAEVPGIDNGAFQNHAEEARKSCPVSQALAVPIEVRATLKS